MNSLSNKMTRCARPTRGTNWIVTVAAKMVTSARAATEHFGAVADAAERAGTSAERMQTLQRVAQANASRAEELSSAMERLRVTIDAAANGDEKAQKAFEGAGISMARLGEIGGDAALVFNELSESGATVSQMTDLMGKSAKGLSSTMQALNGDLDATRQLLVDTGKIASDDVVRQFDELADKGVERANEAFAAWSGMLLDVARKFGRRDR